MTRLDSLAPAATIGAVSDRGPGGMTPAQFVAKWSRAALPERAASHEHFLDLCRLLGQPTPAQHGATGADQPLPPPTTPSPPAAPRSTNTCWRIC